MADKYNISLVKQKGITDKTEVIADVVEFQNELQGILFDFIGKHQDDEYLILLNSILHHYSSFLINKAQINDGAKQVIIDKLKKSIMMD